MNKNILNICCVILTSKNIGFSLISHSFNTTLYLRGQVEIHMDLANQNSMISCSK